MCNSVMILITEPPIDKSLLFLSINFGVVGATNLFPTLEQSPDQPLH